MNILTLSSDNYNFVSSHKFKRTFGRLFFIFLHIHIYIQHIYIKLKSLLLLLFLNPYTLPRSHAGQGTFCCATLRVLIFIAVCVAWTCNMYVLGKRCWTVQGLKRGDKGGPDSKPFRPCEGLLVSRSSYSRLK